MLNVIKLEPLYWGVGQEHGNERVDTHVHDFCQLEICRTGRRVCRGKGVGDILLNPGDSVFIPTGQIHSFRAYKNRESTYFSFKFRLPPDVIQPKTICKMPGDLFSQWVIERFEQFLQNNSTALCPNIALASELVAMLLAGLLNHWTKQPGDSVEEQDILRFMRRNIYQFGAGISVKYIAGGIDLTVPQFRYRFRKAMDSLPPGSVKYHNPADFITAELMEIAKNHLKNTTFSINEISDMMKFNNVYTFSRFFKHNSGISPLRYRSNFAAAEKAGIVEEK